MEWRHIGNCNESEPANVIPNLGMDSKLKSQSKNDIKHNKETNKTNKNNTTKKPRTN